MQHSPRMLRVNQEILSDSCYRRPQISHFKEENRLILRRVRFQTLPLQANETCLTIELSMVPDLLIGNFKTHRFDIKLLCPVQIFEVEFDTNELRLQSLHEILPRLRSS